MSQQPAKLRQVPVDDAIEWKAYPRIEPGEYFANCYWAKRYRDPAMRRWTCLLRWDVLSDDLQSTIAKCIPLWFGLGEGEKPHASRRGKYLREWVRANGEPPGRGDRLSPNVFTRRIARVEISDTSSPIPYSVVRKIIQWETGPLCHPVSKSTSQGRPVLSAVESEAFALCLADSTAKEKRDGVVGETEGVFPTNPSEDFAFCESGKKEKAGSFCNPLPVVSIVSARAGVEGENTPAHTQGAGAPGTANPPKAHESAERTTKRDGFLIRSVSANNCNQGSYKDA